MGGIPLIHGCQGRVGLVHRDHRPSARVLRLAVGDNGRDFDHHIVNSGSRPVISISTQIRLLGSLHEARFPGRHDIRSVAVPRQRYALRQ